MLCRFSFKFKNSIQNTLVIRYLKNKWIPPSSFWYSPWNCFVYIDNLSYFHWINDVPLHQQPKTLCISNLTSKFSFLFRLCCNETGLNVNPEFEWIPFYEILYNHKNDVVLASKIRLFSQNQWCTAPSAVQNAVYIKSAV